MSLVIKAWDLIKSKVQPAFAFALRGQKKKVRETFQCLECAVHAEQGLRNVQ